MASQKFKNKFEYLPIHSGAHLQFSSIGEWKITRSLGIYHPRSGHLFRVRTEGTNAQENGAGEVTASSVVTEAIYLTINLLLSGKARIVHILIV